MHINGTISTHICPPIFIKNQELEQVNSYKYLGIEFDKE